MSSAGQMTEDMLIMPIMSYAAAGAANVYMGGSFFAMAPLFSTVGLATARSMLGQTRRAVVYGVGNAAVNTLFLNYFLGVPYETGIVLNVAALAGEMAGAYILFQIEAGQPSNWQ